MTPEFCASRARAGVPAVGRNSPFTHVGARLVVPAAGKVKVGDARLKWSRRPPRGRSWMR
jgi:hypothetical protein